MTMGEHACMEHDYPSQCEGDVRHYQALSGSGMSYPRCERGYAEYLDRVQPRMTVIRRRYRR
jgi:hypothetical protein